MEIICSMHSIPEVMTREEAVAYALEEDAA